MNAVSGTLRKITTVGIKISDSVRLHVLCLVLFLEGEKKSLRYANEKRGVFSTCFLFRLIILLSDEQRWTKQGDSPSPHTTTDGIEIINESSIVTKGFVCSS